MLETIEGVLAVAITLAAATERLIEIVKPLFEKIPNLDWQKAAKVAGAVLVGFGLSALTGFDVLAQFGLSVAPVLGYAAGGLLISAGSSTIHPILEWLKTIKNPS